MEAPGKSKSVTEYTYVMASTLNQMTNYIPLKMELEGIKFTNIYSVTLEKHEEKVKDNNDWDKNFKSVVNDLPITDIKIDQQTQLLNVVNTIEEISNALKNETRPIFWNITGGQRPYLMAVWEFTKKRPNDIIAYLEGNTGKIVIFKHNDKQELICIDSNTSYAIEGLTIEFALNLMGYNVKATKSTNATGLKSINKYIDLWKLYTQNESLRKAFVVSNTKQGDIDNVKQHISDTSLYFILEKHKSKEYPFGYILEDVVVAVLKNEFEGEIAEVAHSIKLEFNDSDLNEDVGGKILDEFDILLLTKTGQLYNFECKSGGMSGDVAKSTKYSTYAISGVYGKPILITPLTKNEIDGYRKLPDDFKYIKSAIRSAKRATLKVWGIDNIVTEIKEKLGI
jgi:hypothetical protein